MPAARSGKPQYAKPTCRESAISSQLPPRNTRAGRLYRFYQSTTPRRSRSYRKGQGRYVGRFLTYRVGGADIRIGGNFAVIQIPGNCFSGVDIGIRPSRPAGIIAVVSSLIQSFIPRRQFPFHAGRQTETFGGTIKVIQAIISKSSLYYPWNFDDIAFRIFINTAQTRPVLCVIVFRQRVAPDDGVIPIDGGHRVGLMAGVKEYFGAEVQFNTSAAITRIEGIAMGLRPVINFFP